MIYLTNKDRIRQVLLELPFNVSANLRYDRYTFRIIEKVLRSDSNAIDVGCHKGEILDKILRQAPKGSHLAFEPLPHLNQELKKYYGGRAKIFPFALSCAEGSTEFQFVRNAPAYSGFRKRVYAVSQPDIEQIQVEVRRLDDIVSNDTQVDLIKIDVEGAEFEVLSGALQTLERCQPVVIFESGLGASEFYGTTPDKLFKLLKSVGLHLYTLKAFLNDANALELAEFEDLYMNRGEFYWVAAPSKQ